MSGKLDFPKLRERFTRLDAGAQAEIRRVAHPDELDERPAFYRLFPACDLEDRVRRVAFCLPWVAHAEGRRLGAELAKAKISDRRLFQVMRSSYPNDVIQLRRLLQYVTPSADWNDLGPILMRWSREDKRRLLEEYYLRSSALEPENLV